MLPRSKWIALTSLLFTACASPPEAAEREQGAPSATPDQAPAAAPGAAAPARSVHGIAAIGDSITQGFDADDEGPIAVASLATDLESVFHEKPSLSWIQGTDARVSSIASRLRANTPDLVVTPVSVSGAEVVGRSDGVPNLEDQALAIGQKGAKPDLVYVLLGGNDVCERPPSTTDDPTATLYSLDVWRQAVERGFTALTSVLGEGATVRVVSMPRVDFLYNAAHDMAIDWDLSVFDTGSSCSDLWDLADTVGQSICGIVTAEPSAEKRTQIGRRIDEYNQALADEVHAFNASDAVKKKGIVFQTDWSGPGTSGTSVGTYQFSSDEVSHHDCFHPNFHGQNAIASIVAEKAHWSQ